MQTRTRATRRADENAPPPLGRTRSSTSTTTLATQNVKAALSTRVSAKPTIANDPAVPASAGMKARSGIPVMKRAASNVGVSKEGKVDASKPRAALGEVTNAAKKAAQGKDGKVVEKKPVLSSRSSALTTATRKTRVVEMIKEEKVAPKRKAAAPVRPTSSRTELKPLADKPVNAKVEQDEPARKKRKTSSPVTVHYDDDEFDEGKFDEDGQEILLSSGGRAVRQKSPLRERAKDEGWEDLDAEDEGDPTMVSEYVVDAFNYMMKLEVSDPLCLVPCNHAYNQRSTMANPTYMDDQEELQWRMRTILMDWLIEVHSKFRLLPETLFIAVNLIDRFLSQRVISLVKFQLVGLTALFVAAKYEEVICPSISHFLHMTDGGYGVEEIIKAERYMLSTLSFDLSYPNPLHFLRRISKADGYDIQSRTLGKFLTEISALEHKLLAYPPSLLAASAMWLARLCLERGQWVSATMASCRYRS